MSLTEQYKSVLFMKLSTYVVISGKLSGGKHIYAIRTGTDGDKKEEKVEKILPTIVKIIDCQNRSL